MTAYNIFKIVQIWIVSYFLCSFILSIWKRWLFGRYYGLCKFSTEDMCNYIEYELRVYLLLLDNKNDGIRLLHEYVGCPQINSVSIFGANLRM